MKTETLKVLRPFLLNGNPTKVGQVLENVPFPLAVELRTARKAEKFDLPVTEEKAPVAAPAAPTVTKAATPQKGVK
jgi:hypothetical protein